MFSQLYPGDRQSSPTYRPAIDTLERLFGWSKVQKQQTILRTDAGFGGDDNINYALAHDWQVLTKGHGGRRPAALHKQINAADWLLVGADKWVAPIPKAPIYTTPTQTLLLKWLTQHGQWKMATLVCSILEWSPAQVTAHYDDRALCETQIQTDKGGLKLCKRRKHTLPAQEVLVLLTDLAHNLLAWLPLWMALDKPYTTFGTTRLIEDVLAIPGELAFARDQLVEIRLNEHHPYAADVADGLRALLAHFGDP